MEEIIFFFHYVKSNPFRGSQVGIARRKRHLPALLSDIYSKCYLLTIPPIANLCYQKLVWQSYSFWIWVWIAGGIRGSEPLALRDPEALFVLVAG